VGSKPINSSERARAARVDVVDPARTVRDPAWIARRVGAAVEALGARGEVRVRVVGDAEMARLHEARTGVPGTTDVLTFDLRDEPAGDLDTDVVVCVDEARRQAASRGHALEHELLLYIVHGVLHCLGYDDHDPAGAAAMHAREDEVLRAIGVGAVYAREGSP